MPIIRVTNNRQVKFDSVTAITQSSFVCFQFNDDFLISIRHNQREDEMTRDVLSIAVPRPSAELTAAEALLPARQLQQQAVQPDQPFQFQLPEDASGLAVGRRRLGAHTAAASSTVVSGPTSPTAPPAPGPSSPPTPPAPGPSSPPSPPAPGTSSSPLHTVHGPAGPPSSATHTREPGPSSSALRTTVPGPSSSTAVPSLATTHTPKPGPSSSPLHAVPGPAGSSSATTHTPVPGPSSSSLHPPVPSSSASAGAVSASGKSAIPPGVQPSTYYQRKKRAEKLKKARESGDLMKSPVKKERFNCSKCGKPKTKEHGHSIYKNQHYCSLSGGLSVEEWLAERKRAEAEKKRADPKRKFNNFAHDVVFFLLISFLSYLYL